MPLTLTANPSLSRSFRTAFLLTGNTSHAEDAVLDAIQALDSEQVSEEALLRAAIMAAVMPRRETTAGAQDQAILPPELTRVLHLPTDLRHCFVLRILAGLPEVDCARILNLSIPLVEERICRAVRRLAGNPAASRCLGHQFALVA